MLTHISCPGQALGVVAHQRHEAGDKQAPLCVGTGTSRCIVDVIPFHQNLLHLKNLAKLNGVSLDHCNENKGVYLHVCVKIKP